MSDDQTNIRIDRCIKRKMKFIGKYNDRSAAKEVRFALRAYIAEFEKKHGPIRLEDLPP